MADLTTLLSKFLNDLYAGTLGTSFTLSTVLTGDGSASAPGLTFASDTDTGIFKPEPNAVGIAGFGTEYMRVRSSTSNANVSFLGSIGLGANAASGDVILERVTANTLALKNGISNQTARVYGYSSGSRALYGSLKTVTTTLSGVSGATVTATSLIPARVWVIGVATSVITALGATNGTTGYAVGDGTDANRWGDVVGVAAGTHSSNSDATADPTGQFSAANNVVLTAAGGNFDGTGAIVVSVTYLTTGAA